MTDFSIRRGYVETLERRLCLSAVVFELSAVIERRSLDEYIEASDVGDIDGDGDIALGLTTTVAEELAAESGCVARAGGAGCRG